MTMYPRKAKERTHWLFQNEEGYQKTQQHIREMDRAFLEGGMPAVKKYNRERADWRAARDANEARLGGYQLLIVWAIAVVALLFLGAQP